MPSSFFSHHFISFLYQQLESLRHVLYRQKLQMRQFFHLFDRCPGRCTA